MSDDINYKNNPLHGLSLKNLLIEIVEHYGYEILYAHLNINCFRKNPSIESSIKFLKKTDWAREKVEAFYLYQYKNLPRASEHELEIPPRDRIIPDNHVPGEPVMLSIEGYPGRNKGKRSNQDSGNNPYGGKSYGGQSKKPRRESRDDSKSKRERKPPSDNSNTSSDGNDPWSKWR